MAVYLNVKDSRNKQRVLEEGDYTIGWLVQANNKLFEDGDMDLPALVLISPDSETARDEEFMTDLADRIMDLKGTDPDDAGDKAEARVAELMADEMYVEGKRDRLPKGFASGRKVYLAHIFVYRDLLPGKKLRGRRIPCALFWDDEETMICTRPPSKKARRRPAEDDD